MTQDDRVSLAILGIVGVGMGTIAVRFGTAVDLSAAGLGHAVSAVVVGAVVVAGLVGGVSWRGRSAAGKARGLVGHSHGAGRVLLRHEGGHVVGAKSLRAFDRAWVKSDSGMVLLRRSKVDALTPAQYLAFCKVGELAAGTSAGCSADRANYRAELGRMRDGGASSAEVAKARRIGDMLAARWAASSDVDRWADVLGERGKL